MTISEAADRREPRQSPKAVVMVLPHHFYPNAQTAADNAFQHDAGDDRRRVAQTAHDEVTQAARSLEAAGVTVHLFEDTGHDTPDSVFPNNWFTTHSDGRVALYPMYATSRRAERRQDVIDRLKACYHVTDVVDYSPFEAANLFLEGTGALVLDRLDRVAYVSLSHRANAKLLDRFCADFDYEPLAFETRGPDGCPIYHTNVMMNVGTSLALVGLDCIADDAARQRVRDRLEASGRTVIDLSGEQIAQFAGNALELEGSGGPLLTLSQTAFDSLSRDQIRRIEAVKPILPLAVPTIELAGGSARCMLAGIHLAPLKR